MVDLQKLITSMSEEQQTGALLVLDAISRPLRTREIELALRKRPMSRSRALSLARELEQFQIIAIVDPERP